MVGERGTTIVHPLVQAGLQISPLEYQSGESANHVSSKRDLVQPIRAPQSLQDPPILGNLLGAQSCCTVSLALLLLPSSEAWWTRAQVYHWWMWMRGHLPVRGRGSRC